MPTKLLKKLFIWASLATIIAISVLVIQFLRFQYETVSISDAERTFTIESGSNIKTIAQQLSLEKIIDDPWLFILLAKIKGVETSVRAGEYQLQQAQSPSDLLELFTKGQSIQYSFTIIEGRTFRQMMQELRHHPIIINTLEGKSDAEIMAAIGFQDQQVSDQLAKSDPAHAAVFCPDFGAPLTRLFLGALLPPEGFLVC